MGKFWILTDAGQAQTPAATDDAGEREAQAAEAPAATAPAVLDLSDLEGEGQA